MRVVAFTKYDREAAATRQRFLQYAPFLAQAGFALDYRPLLGDAYVRSLATREPWSRGALVGSYVRRIRELLGGAKADLLWVHAELFPYLPFAFERLAFRSGVPVVYDCDDAYFVRYNDKAGPLFRTAMAGKIERLMERSAAATCGNEHLRQYVERFCPRSLLFPTVVDIDAYKPVEQRRDRLTIGWIGSPSTWRNVQPFLPMLRDICASGNVRFRAVGAGVRAEPDRFEGMELVEWSEEREIAEVQGFDIGIMPLLDGAFERGKSGYKLVQYIACGVPAVASRVGANTTILRGGCGIFASSEADWRTVLERLIADAELRRELSEKGRQRAVEEYSLQAYAPKLVALFREIAR